MKGLLTKVDKALKSLKSEGGERTLVMIDNLNTAMIGAGPLEWLEIIGDWSHWADASGVSICIGVNRDLIDEQVMDFYRDVKNSSFDYIFEV